MEDKILTAIEIGQQVIVIPATEKSAAYLSYEAPDGTVYTSKDGLVGIIKSLTDEGWTLLFPIQRKTYVQ